MSLSIFFFGCKASDLDENDTKDDNKKEEEQVIEYEPVYGGEIVVPISYVKTLNPLLIKEKSLYHFSKLIYEGLFDFDKNLNIKNVLAESYSISEDGQKVKIKLREDVVWHDGEKFTAEDVKFTLDLIKYGAMDSVYRQRLTAAFKPAKPNDLEHILNVKIEDDYNLIINFDRSYSSALESLILPILPKHQFVKEDGSIKEGYNKALSIENFNPIGTGPYKFANYNKLKSVELVVNENWWKGKPYISKITGKILSNDELAITSLNAGEIDLAFAVGLDWEKYTQNDKVKIYEYPTQVYEFLGFNFRNKLFLGEKGKALRKAIAYGIDKNTIINKAFLGHGTNTYLPIQPKSWLTAEGLDSYNFNVNKAKEILEEAGWSDTDGDGFYEDENNKDLAIRLLTNSYNRLRKATADIIIENLNSIGIKAVPAYDTRQYDNITQEMVDNQWAETQEKISKGDFDVVLLGWELSYLPDLSFAFHSSEIQKGTNFIAYENEVLDELLVKAFRAGTREEKKEVYRELEELLLEELPYISLFFRDSAILTSEKVWGEVSPQSFNVYYGIENWFIPESYQQKKQ
jgi:peptide/nickel transport system substrate-binding protein